jgi:hypothetical protein
MVVIGDMERTELDVDGKLARPEGQTSNSLLGTPANWTLHLEAR